MQVMENNKIERLLSRPFNVDILKNKTHMGLYLENPFRLLSLSGCASQQETEAVISSFNNRHRLLGNKVLNKNASKLGYCKDSAVKDPKLIVARLDHPLKRIFNEIFWFSLPQPLIDQIKESDAVGDGKARSIIREAYKNNGHVNNALYRHAIAISYHNAAIHNELEYLMGMSSLDSRLWRKAFKNWSETLNDEKFWQHFEERIQSINDFRLTTKDLDELKEKTPGIILSFNSIFADVYGNMDRMNDLKRHIKMLTEGGFSKPLSKKVLQNIAVSRIDEEIRPLVTRVNDRILSKEGKISYETLKKTLDNVLDKTGDVYKLWYDLRYPEEMLISQIMNELAELVLKTTNKLDYSGDQQKMNLIYNLLIFEKLSEIPIESSTKIKINKEARKVRDILYPEHADLPESISPTKCWFIATETTDPASCILLPFHKIDSNRGANVSWKKHEVLIPRSKLAKDIHEERIKKMDAQEKFKKRFTAEQFQLEDLKKQVKEISNELNKKCDKEILSAQHSAEVKISEFTQAYAAKKGIPAGEIKKLEVYRKQAIIKIENSRGIALKQIDDIYKDIIYRKKKKLEKQPSKGLKLSLSISSGILCGAASYFIEYKTKGIVSGEAMAGFAFITIGGGCFINLAITAITGINRRWKSFSIKRIEKKIDGKKRQINQAFNKQRKGIADNLEKKFPQLCDVVKAIKEKTIAIEDSLNRELDQIRNEAVEAIKEKTSYLQSKINEIESRIQIEIKDKGHQDKFPSLQNINKNGYKTGERPPQNEIDQIIKDNMTRYMNSLTEHEKMILAARARVMSNSDFANYLSNLIDSNQRPSLR